MAINSLYSDFNAALPKQTDGDVERNTDVFAVKNAIMNILLTRKGSRRMMPDFGAGLWYLLFEPMDKETGNSIGQEILSALENWEPRVIINNVNVNVNYDWNQYEISIDYSIVGRPLAAGTVSLILKAL